MLGRRRRVIRVPCWPIDATAAALRPVNRNAAGFLTFFRQSLSRDMVGTPAGVHHLAGFFHELAAAGPG